MGEKSAESTVKAPLLAVLSFIVVALGAAAGKTSLSFPLLICAVLCAYIANRPAGLPFALGAATLSGVAGYFTGGALFAVKCVVTIAVLGAVIFICRRRGAGLFITSVAAGGAHLLMTAAFFAVSLYVEYKDVAVGARTVMREFYAAAGDMIRNMYRDGNTYKISDEDVNALLSAITTMLPGIILAAWQAMGAALYFLMKLICRLTGDTADVKDEYRVPETPVIFFAVSLVISLILSPFEGAKVARIAAVDICIALSVSSAICGIVAIVRKIKHPETVSLPDGTVVRRFPFLPVAAMVISVFINPFMPFGVAAIYGSALTVKNAVKRSINKDKKDG